MAEKRPGDYTSGQTVVKYRGERYKTPPPVARPEITFANAEELDALMATAEGQLAAQEAEEEEQRVWDFFAAIASDAYEKDLRERRFYNAMHAPGSPRTTARKKRWMGLMSQKPYYPPP